MKNNAVETDELTDMTQGAVLPLIMWFALPLFIGNIFQQLYTTADCFVVGRFLGKESLAAIGSTSQLVLTVVNFFNGFSTGAQVLISQCFGSKNILNLRKSVHTALVSSFLISIFMTGVGLFTSPMILHLIGVPDEVFAEADAYLKIYFSGIVFLIFYNMGSGILRALGDSTRPLCFLIFSSLVNIILDLFFVVKLELGVEGVAWATVISEAVSTIPVLCSLIFTRQVYKLSIKELKIDPSLFSKMMKIGLPGAISSSITAFANTFMQKYVYIFGASCMAGWSVFSRFDQLVHLPMRSISFAATTFIAQNYGAGQKDRINKGIKVSFIVSVLMIFVLSVLLFIFSKPLTRLFISDIESVEYGNLFMKRAAPFYIFCVTCMLHSQILRGLGDSIIPTVLSFSGFVVLRQTILFIGTKISSSFWIVSTAYPVIWIFTAVAMSIYFKIFMKKNTML